MTFGDETHVQKMLKIYSQCLNFKNCYSKRVNTSQSAPAFFEKYLFHHSCYLWEQYWKSSFVSVFMWCNKKIWWMLLLCIIQWKDSLGKIVWCVLIYLTPWIWHCKTFGSFPKSKWPWKVSALNQSRTSGSWDSTTKGSHKTGLTELVQKVLRIMRKMC